MSVLDLSPSRAVAREGHNREWAWRKLTEYNLPPLRRFNGRVSCMARPYAHARVRDGQRLLFHASLGRSHGSRAAQPGVKMASLTIGTLTAYREMWD